MAVAGVAFAKPDGRPNRLSPADAAAELVILPRAPLALGDIGAAIADADPVVAQVRARNMDARYSLGFDIASGIFGNPALGAQGNTATGPGSMGIRDALSAPAQEG